LGSEDGVAVAWGLACSGYAEGGWYVHEKMEKETTHCSKGGDAVAAGEADPDEAAVAEGEGAAVADEGPPKEPVEDEGEGE